MTQPSPSQRTKFLREEERFKGRYSSTVFDTLAMAYRPVKWPVLLTILIGFLGRGLLLGNTNIIGYWVDSFCQGKGCKAPPALFADFTTQEYLMLLGSFTAAGFVFVLIFRIGFSRLSALSISKIYDEATLRTSRLPMSFYDTTPAGRIITRFSTDYSNVFRLFGGPLAEFFSIVMDLILMILLISLASLYYLPLVLIMAAISYSIYRYNRPRLKNERRELSAVRSPSISHFAETAQGASTIRAFRRGPSFMQRFDKLNNLFLKQRLTTYRFIFLFSFQMNFLTALLLIGTGFLAFYLVQAGLVTLGSIGVAFGFILLSGTALTTFFEWMSQLEEAVVGVERLDFYLRQKLEPGAQLPASTEFDTSHPVRPAGEPEEDHQIIQLGSEQASLSVQDLWLRYREDLPWVLKGVSFQLSPGERLGVIGRTGSGKTTLIQSLFYLYPFGKGHINLAGRVPRIDVNQEPQENQIDLVAYRKAIGFITQEPTLFRGLLRDNITMNPDITDQECYEALERVGLAKRVRELGGLDFFVEEKGRNLSAGEKQLLCMARCLLQQSPIVIMDEATSSIDPQSEDLLVRATDEFFAGKTQVIVAHRLSTLLHCHRILWLDQGKVKMLGPTSEVLQAFHRQAQGQSQSSSL